jgi:hypothetical protein
MPLKLARKLTMVASGPKVGVVVWPVVNPTSLTHLIVSTTHAPKSTSPSEHKRHR